MTKHRTGTRRAWLAARLELLEAEEELTRRSDERARRRQALPWVRIDMAYRKPLAGKTVHAWQLRGGEGPVAKIAAMTGTDVATYYGVSALLFAASAALTIAWSASMSGMGEMPMPGG